MKILVLLITLALPASATNVVFILADDLGYMDVGFNNPDMFYDTPVLNQLATESVRFTDAYAACSVCSPTRASIMTGQYPARTRNTDYSGAPNGREVIPEDPTDIEGGDFSPYTNPNLEDGPEGEHLPNRLASEVANFITAHKDEPFFVYLPFYSVHTPLEGRADLIEKYEEKRQQLGLEPVFEPEHPRKNLTEQQHPVYAAMVEAMDEAIGKVLQAIDDNGLTEDTIVVFFSDNGGLSTAEGWPTSNRPLRAGKGWAYEGGVREPLIVRWPRRAKAGTTSHAPVISNDFYPTLLEACGFDLLPEQHIDGVSFAHLLSNPQADHDRAPLLWH